MADRYPWQKYKRRGAQIEAFRNLTGRTLPLRPPGGRPFFVQAGEWVVRDKRGWRALSADVFESLYEDAEE